MKAAFLKIVTTALFVVWEACLRVRGWYRRRKVVRQWAVKELDFSYCKGWNVCEVHGEDDLRSLIALGETERDAYLCGEICRMHNESLGN